MPNESCVACKDIWLCLNVFLQLFNRHKLYSEMVNNLYKTRQAVAINVASLQERLESTGSQTGEEGKES